MQLRKCFNLFIRGCFGCVFPHAKRSEILITQSLGSCDSDSHKECEQFQMQESVRCFLFVTFLLGSERFYQRWAKIITRKLFGLLCSMGRKAFKHAFLLQNCAVLGLFCTGLMFCVITWGWHLESTQWERLYNGCYFRASFESYRNL